MKKLIGYLFLTCTLGLGFAKEGPWQTLHRGLDYLKLTPQPNGYSIHAFKINLKNYHMEIYLTKESRYPFASVKQLVKENDAILGINGGFFSPLLEPLGLRMSNGNAISPLKKNTSWWGVFYLKNNKAYIVKPTAFKPNAHIQFAIQSGPRLVINGRIPSLKPGLANRSALCINRKGDVIIIATQNGPISTLDFARTISKNSAAGGLGCVNALNLDGGSSTQLYAHIQDFFLHIPTIFPVADVILVKQIRDSSVSL